MNADVLNMLKLHIGMGLETESTENNSLDLQVQIAEIDAEFKAMINGVSSETVDAFDDAKATALICGTNHRQSS